MASMFEGFYENHRDDMAHAFAWYARNDQVLPHFHNSVELVYVLEGILSTTLDGEAYQISQGEMLINSSYTVHSYETPKASYSIIAIIPMAEVPSVRQILSKQSFAARICRDDARGTLQTIMRLMVENCQEHPHALTGLCGAVLGLLIDRVGLVEARQNSHSTFIREVLDFLQAHHTDPLTVKGVADHFGYSRSRFSDIFTKCLQVTLCAYINTLRCRHAAQILRETELPVSEVALQVGFDSLRTFHRVFKDQFGLTPYQYAKKCARK